MATVTTVPTTIAPVVTTVPSTAVVTTNVPSTVISTIAPATIAPVSTTAANPVDVALAALSRHDNVEKLWKEKVTDANLFLKLFGLIAYAFGKSAALKQDQTAIDFSNKSAELVKAVANRRLNQDEAQSLGLSPVQYSSDEAQMSAGQWKLDAEQKLNDFYSVFKARVTQLGITENSNDFGVYSAAAQKQILSLSESKELLPDLKAPATLKTRISTTLQDFNSRIFKDMINAYASQPIGNLTIEGYKTKAALIKGYFASIDTVDIEAQLRQAIKANHDTAEFDTIRGAFANPAADNAKVAEIKAGLDAQISVEKTALEAELTALRGPNGFDGEINAAVQAKNTAEAAKEAARIAYVVARGEFASAATNATPVSQLLSLADADPRISVLRTALGDKATELAAAETALAQKLARFNEIAQYAPGTTNIVGGRLAVVNANLADTARAARVEANKIAAFYNELNLVVGENNKVVRQRALRDIING